MNAPRTSRQYSKGLIVLRRVTSRGTTGLTWNYWQPIITGFHYLLQMMTPRTRTTFSLDLRASRITADAISSRQWSRTAAQVGPTHPNSSNSASLTRSPEAGGCEDRSARVIEPDAAPRYQRWFERVGMRWRPDGRHRADFRIGTNKLRRRIERGHSPLKAATAALVLLPRRTSTEKQRPRSLFLRRSAGIDISRWDRRFRDTRTYV